MNSATSAPVWLHEVLMNPIIPSTSKKVVIIIVHRFVASNAPSVKEGISNNKHYEDYCLWRSVVACFDELPCMTASALDFRALKPNCFGDKSPSVSRNL